MRRAAIVALAALAIGSGASAFNAADVSARSASANVVALASGYDGVTTVEVTAPPTGSVSAKVGVRVANQGPSLAQTIAWTTTNAGSLTVATTQCAAPTAAGATCEVKFSVGPQPGLPSTYSFTGKVDASGTGYRSTVPGITVSVRYCAIC